MTIPDAHENEFTGNLKLVATHLYFVDFTKEEPELHIIPKDEVDKHSREHSVSKTVRFASSLSTRLRNGEFRVEK
ncbi:hypothetical protein AKJ43_02940 [candidate division MSBL1 archaeon SCGC-AAA261D19]|uniref:Uncharacterized protein n=1 Tax=candidate division MSBL1 archaeon SCGC-AAA261D19 TaxID=1698273 RepID=A0A133V609_9EURY|nr:hypothetical protein AKJ43_02940 [candidate division MSBL1 archaeon SCGC-AAA261D19]